MSAGLLLAVLGDVLIGYDFIIGAATFAIGHMCFVIGTHAGLGAVVVAFFKK